MIRRVGRLAVAFAAAIAALAGTTHAATFSACTAADIFARDPSCRATGACNISQIFIIGDGCTLDFGTRAVTVLSSGELRILVNTVTIRAGSFTVAPGGYVNARGDQPAPNNHGGLVSFFISGAFTIAHSGAGNGRVDASADALAGAISVDAGGDITIQGRLTADQLAVAGTGGVIGLNSGGDILITAGAAVIASGGLQGYGGAVTLAATGRIQVDDNVDVQGAEGGLFSVEADADAIVDRVLASATGDAGTGGSVSIRAGTTVQLVDVIYARGSSSIDGTFGGDGGIVDLSALYGDLTVGAEIAAEGAAPDGAGGSVTLQAAGSVLIEPLVPLSVRGNGGRGDGGDLTVDAGLDATLGGVVDATGGLGGGSTDITARRDVTIARRLDVSGREVGGYGGVVLVVAGSEGKGSLFVNDRIDAGGGGCSELAGCGGGGAIDLFACDATVSPLGEVLARGPSGGAITLSARELLTVSGPVDAVGTSTQGTQGAIGLYYPSRRPAVIVPGKVTPAPDVSALGTCTGPGQLNCIDPCPTCGNGAVEFPETCDQAGPPAGCDGCSSFCRVESCNDLNGCTIDSCSPTLGCLHLGAPDGTSCTDGLVCNGPEVCTGAVCRPGAPLICDDAKTCTLDSCAEPAGCAYAPAPPSLPCNDNNACTVNDRCNGAGQCAPGVPIICNDGLECTNDTCVPASGCVYTNRTGPCTDDGLQCTSDTCNLGLCTHPFRANGTPCDDGLFCTVADSCFAGVCLFGPARSCADTSTCTTDSCDEVVDACVHTPVPCCGNGIVEGAEECDDGNQSNTDACLTTCLAAVCGDGIVRTGVEQCDAGAANSNAPNASCRLDCSLSRCGDGIVDTLRGEQCDDANGTAGDGCSATCFIEPPPTAAPIGGKGSPSSDCVTEWKMDRPALDTKGVPSVKQTCRDNDPLCDFDPAPGACVFRVWVCANGQDPNLPLCVPGSPALGTPAVVTVPKPTPGDATKRVEDAQNRNALLSSVPALRTATLNACGPRLSLRVPLKDPTRTGSKSLKLRAVTQRGIVDSDQLKLYCTP